MTEFPHVPEHIRPICDAFVQGWRSVSQNRAYDPSKPDRTRIIAGAYQLYEVTHSAGASFIPWALAEHCKRLKARYVPSPWSLRWLWEEYQSSRQRELARPERIIDSSTGLTYHQWEDGTRELILGAPSAD